MKLSIPFLDRYLTVTGDTNAITFLDMTLTDETDGVPLGEMKKAQAQLRRYAAGEKIDFDLNLDPKGTPFQKKVWKAMCEIPYGETRSYGDLARSIGSPKAFRAVGGACHRNPISIVQPCHRVVGTNGSLTGFFGGLDLKATLLDFEKH
jgi:methylated-DNA-[protein]-cysteine S-methyltransferase